MSAWTPGRSDAAPVVGVIGGRLALRQQFASRCHLGMRGMGGQQAGMAQGLFSQCGTSVHSSELQIRRICTIFAEMRCAQECAHDEDGGRPTFFGTLVPRLGGPPWAEILAEG